MRRSGYCRHFCFGCRGHVNCHRKGREDVAKGEEMIGRERLQVLEEAKKEADDT